MGCQCTKNSVDDNVEIIRNHEKKDEEIEELTPTPFKEIIKNEREGSEMNQLCKGLNDESESIKSPMIKINDSMNMKGTERKNYNQRVFELINEIRANPPKYADIINNSIKFIQVEEQTDINQKPKIIYKQKIKVALTRGEPAFREAIENLKKLDPLPPLKFKKEISIDLPDSIEQIKDSNYLKSKVLEIQAHHHIDIYFKDLVKDPDISTLLIIVDDNGKNAGRKRGAILNPDYKNIAINSKFIGKTFVAYFSFSSY